MKIACLAKYCVDPVNLVFDKPTGRYDFERSPRKINEVDQNAVEEAVRIKATSNCVVHIYSVGPTEAAKPLRELLGMGADKAFLISDPELRNADSHAIADLLMRAIQKQAPYDLILSGYASEDSYAGSVALMLAEMLGIPHVAYASKLSINGRTLTAVREVDGKIETVEANLPVLVTVTRELNTPRYVSALQTLRVPRDALTTIRLPDLGETPEEFASTCLSEMLDPMAVPTNRKNIILDGADSAAVVKKLLDSLRTEGAL
ncbi:MAG: electron transfer flavoprotein subunit beta/FixA family protein [Candidatus Bathyarchaeia archaeon]